jgi:2-dehydropantoate 2-reductase
MIMGAGAIGSVFGGFLAKAGHDVTLIGRPWHLNPIREKGLHIRGIWGDYRITNLTCRTSIPDDVSFDLVLLSVKSYQTRQAVTELCRHLPKNVPILSLQNGLGNLEILSELAGAERTLGGRVIFGAEIPAPGEVRVTVIADAVAIGPMKGSSFPYEKVEEFASVMDASGTPCRATHEIERFIWAKVLYNVALNAPAAILGINYGKLLDHEATKDLMGILLSEAFAVAKAEGIPLEWSSSEEYQETLFRRLLPPTASHFPSMLQDIAKGKKTEIDALNGALVRLGEKHGIPTPVNRTLTLLIRFKEEFK